jgi:hypothetical protein
MRSDITSPDPAEGSKGLARGARPARVRCDGTGPFSSVGRDLQALAVEAASRYLALNDKNQRLGRNPMDRLQGRAA